MNAHEQEKQKSTPELFHQRRSLFKMAEVIVHTDTLRQESTGPGMPIVESDGSISLYSTESPYASDLDKEEGKQSHGALEISTYDDEEGAQHVVTLHAFDQEKYSGNITSPTMVAVETVTGHDGTTILGSEPAVLVTCYDDEGVYVSQNELTKALYECFGDEESMVNFMKAKLGSEDADTALYEEMNAQLALRLRERYPERGSMIKPATAEFWKNTGIKTTEDQTREEEEKFARVEDKNKEKERRWKEKGKFGRAATRISWRMTSPETRTYDVRDW